ESGHTVILGWSAHVFSIVAELVTAASNQKRSCITILAQKDKVEMEDELADKVGEMGNTRVVCRTGDPLDLDDLGIINPHEAPAFIVLTPEGEADSYAVKAILALSRTLGTDDKSHQFHVVAEIRDRKNAQVARMVGGDHAELV